jgi:hypothetical protein
MNKEHIFPQWLILRTGTQVTGIRWGDKRRVPALSVTLPLCVECNRLFGEHLEGPTARVFEDLEVGRGISDDEAELLVRWMWKIKGLASHALFPDGKYTQQYVLRDRVLHPIDAIRGHLVLGVALVAGKHPDSEDLPMGVDAVTNHDAIFMSGVFSRIAMMVGLSEFESLIPIQFGRYRLAPERHPLNAGKLFYPPTTFKDDVDAVYVTARASRGLSLEHDRRAIRLIQESTNS